MKKSTHHETAQAIIALLVVLIAAGVFFLFYAYRDFILLSGNFSTFFILTTIVFALLITLVYLAFNSHAHPKTTKASPKKTTKSKTPAKSTKKKKK